MKGVIKSYKTDRGFGFITPEGGGADTFFHVSEWISQQEIRPGTEVAFEYGAGRNGKPAARNVEFVAEPSPFIAPPAAPPRRAYYGKPTKQKGHMVPADEKGTVVGIGLGLLLGPIGGLVGGLLGSGGFKRTEGKLITGECLRCGGTGHVTNFDDHYIGFQCEKCLSFWKKRNTMGLKKSDLE